MALLLLALPAVAQANMGTPLMWAGMLHLVVGNLIIGLLEGILLAKLFKLPKARAIGLLILANYFSAWVGGLFLRGAILRAVPMDLGNAWRLFWIMVFVTYVMTLVFEFPFVAIAFRGDPRWRRKAVRASLIIQTVSYAMLFGWYWNASGTTLYTQTEVVELSSISLPEQVLMYYISVDDGDVYRMSLAGPDARKVFDLNSARKDDRLLVRVSSADSNRWDLMARLDTEDHRKPEVVTIQKSVASVAAPAWSSMNANPAEYEGTWFNFGKVPKLGQAESSPWEFQSGVWAMDGLHGTKGNTDTTVGFSFETPFGAWVVRNATHLPTDKVLLQLGEDQICIYDPETEQIALVAKGRGPIAVMEERTQNQRVQTDADGPRR